MKPIEQFLTQKQSRKQIILEKAEEDKNLKIMSYNILAPSAIEKYLYPKHTEEDLETNKRFGMILH